MSVPVSQPTHLLLWTGTAFADTFACGAPVEAHSRRTTMASWVTCPECRATAAWKAKNEAAA